jgi:hypothetical protein
LGFSGLGPPRNDLRSYPQLKALLPYRASLSLGIFAWIGVVGIIVQSAIRRPKTLRWSFSAAFLSGGVLGVASSMVVRHQFWGRHLAGLFPFLIFALLQWVATVSGDAQVRISLRLALGFLALTWGLSDLRLRLLPEYGKDDYRRATEVVLSEAKESGGPIVWVADVFTARYYGLVLANVPELSDTLLGTPWKMRGKGVVATNWTHEQVVEFLRDRNCKLVLASSKPDLYDREGAWSAEAQTCAVGSIETPNAFHVYVLDEQRKAANP